MDPWTCYSSIIPNNCARGSSNFGPSGCGDGTSARPGVGRSTSTNSLVVCHNRTHPYLSVNCSNSQLQDIGLQSPFLQSPKLPRALVHEFTRFATQICPNISILPILIHDQKVLYLPSPTELIHREDITTLVRYLLSLLGGSEAKRAQARSPPKAKPAQDEQNLIMKRLSTIDLASLANFQPKLPSTTFTLQPASDWAHRAFKWASTSLVLPVNPFDNAAEADSLDQLLRADIGLPPRTAPSQLLRIKSSLSNPELVTEAIPSPTPRPPQRAASSTGVWRRNHNFIA